MVTTLTTGQRCKRWLLRHPGVTRLGVVMVMAAIWEIAGRYWVDPDYLSPPSKVLLGLPSVFKTEGVPAALLQAFYERPVGGQDLQLGQFADSDPTVVFHFNVLDLTGDPVATVSKNQNWTPVVHMVDDVKSRLDGDVYGQFFKQFSLQGLLGRFLMLHFTAWKFPHVGMRFMGRPQGNEKFSFAFKYCCGHQKGGFARG